MKINYGGKSYETLDVLLGIHGISGHFTRRSTRSQYNSSGRLIASVSDYKKFYTDIIPRYNYFCQETLE